MSESFYIFSILCLIIYVLIYYGKDSIIYFLDQRFNKIVKQITDLNNKKFFSKLDLSLVKENLENNIIKHQNWEEFAKKQYKEIYDNDFNKFQKQLNNIKEYNQKALYILKINKQIEVIEQIFEQIKNEKFWEKNSINVEKLIDFIQ